jgi:hypothetical protein
MAPAVDTLPIHTNAHDGRQMPDGLPECFPCNNQMANMTSMQPKKTAIETFPSFRMDCGMREWKSRRGFGESMMIQPLTMV